MEMSRATKHLLAVIGGLFVVSILTAVLGVVFFLMEPPDCPVAVPINPMGESLWVDLSSESPPKSTLGLTGVGSEPLKLKGLTTPTDEDEALPAAEGPVEIMTH